MVTAEPLSIYAPALRTRPLVYGRAPAVEVDAETLALIAADRLAATQPYRVGAPGRVPTWTPSARKQEEWPHIRFGAAPSGRPLVPGRQIEGVCAPWGRDSQAISNGKRYRFEAGCFDKHVWGGLAGAERVDLLAEHDHDRWLGSTEAQLGGGRLVLIPQANGLAFRCEEATDEALWLVRSGHVQCSIAWTVYNAHLEGTGPDAVTVVEYAALGHIGLVAQGAFPSTFAQIV